jgi:cyclopropane-fatty-acyl-phospholipid synthase
MEKIIKKKLESNNSISLSRFMNLCLYKKNIGFYEQNIIGSHFLTSPEISQVFGECIALFFLTTLSSLKLNNFIELGPGNGTLMVDIVRTFSNLSNEKFNFFLYEKSNYLKKIQEDTLKDYHSEKSKIIQLNKLKLEKKPYMFFCNEFFDALPINQYLKKEDNVYEKRIIFQENKPQFLYKKNNDIKFNNLSNGEIIEYSPLTNLYLRKIFKHIKNYGGALLIFDYGPFEKKLISTLQAIYKSEKCGIFDYPYNSDMTYHVDFNNIKKISKEYKLEYLGPITQKQFLFFYGINERTYNLSLKTKSKQKRENLFSQFKRLTDPNGMGDLFKCVFITKNNMKLPSFSKI